LLARWGHLSVPASQAAAAQPLKLMCVHAPTWQGRCWTAAHSPSMPCAVPCLSQPAHVSCPSPTTPAPQQTHAPSC
jgi:hypothetical protein